MGGNSTSFVGAAPRDGHRRGRPRRHCPIPGRWPRSHSCFQARPGPMSAQRTALQARPRRSAGKGTRPSAVRVTRAATALPQAARGRTRRFISPSLDTKHALTRCLHSSRRPRRACRRARWGAQTAQRRKLAQAVSARPDRAKPHASACHLSDLRRTPPTPCFCSTLGAQPSAADGRHAQTCVCCQRAVVHASNIYNHTGNLSQTLTCHADKSVPWPLEVVVAGSHATVGAPLCLTVYRGCV